MALKSGRVEYIYGGMGRVSLDLLDMRWKMSLRLGFDMICDKGNSL